MKTLSLCEALTGPYPSAFNNNIKSWKLPGFVPSSSSVPKRRSRCNYFKFVDRCHEHAKEDNQLSWHIHLTPFGEMHDMKFRCIDGNKSLNLEDNKFGYFLIVIIRDIIKGHYVYSSLKDNSASFPEFRVGLKIALLIGILIFQASQQAIAAPEFTHGVHSPSFLEDLGDINTGILADLFL